VAEGPKREMKHPGGSWLHWPGAGNPLNDLDAPCRYPEVSSPFLNGILPKVGCHQIRKSISSAHGFSLLASGVGASGFRVEQMGDGEKPVPSAVPWNVSSSNKGEVRRWMFVLQLYSSPSTPESFPDAVIAARQ